MMPDVKLQQLRYFLLVADLKSYHAAAEMASRTQPAISLAIRELEHKLGEALFEKGNKAELTPFGRQCYPQAKALLEHYTRVIDQMSMAAERRTGQVAIACVPSFASQMLPDILKGFVIQHPEIAISVEDEPAEQVHQRVLHRNVDFGVGSLWNVDVNLSFETLCRDPMGLVCRRDHPLAQSERPLEWTDLRDENLITNGTVRLLNGTPAREIMERARLSVSNIISLWALLRAGIGVTTLPRLAVDDNDPELCFVPLANPHVEREVGLLAPRRYSLSPAAQALYDATLDYARSRDEPAAASGH